MYQIVPNQPTEKCPTCGRCPTCGHTPGYRHGYWGPNSTPHWEPMEPMEPYEITCVQSPDQDPTSQTPGVQV